MKPLFGQDEFCRAISEKEFATLLLQTTHYALEPMLEQCVRCDTLHCNVLQRTFYIRQGFGPYLRQVLVIGTEEKRVEKARFCRSSGKEKPLPIYRT